MKLATTLLTGGLLALGTAAGAATCTVPVSGPDVDYELTIASASQCQTGNDTNTIDAAFELFGETGWKLADKNDDLYSGDQSILFTTAPVNGAQSGAWAINGGTIGEVAVNLKAGNSWSAFLVSALSGNWSSSKNLSHASIYYRDGGVVTPGVSPVPVPAAAWLMLGALGALGAASRKRRA